MSAAHVPTKTSRLVLRYIGRNLRTASGRDIPGLPEHMDGLPPGREFEVPARGIVLGRSSNADVQVLSVHVDPQHVRLWPVEDGIAVDDLASTTGTAVNGAVLSLERGPALLRPGDRLSLAETHDFEIVERG
jgi:hypothetical protein